MASPYRANHDGEDFGVKTNNGFMASRGKSTDDLDFYPTPPWATRALCENIGKSLLKMCACWEPACGDGDMVRPLSEYFREVDGTDIASGHDFLKDTPYVHYDWIITNPPFKLAQKFCERARYYAKFGAAMLVRTAFLEGQQRYRDLFSCVPPTTIFQFTERVPIFKGRLDPDGSTAASYCWVVWHKNGAPGTTFRWIPPCRKRLERESDYEHAKSESGG